MKVKRAAMAVPRLPDVPAAAPGWWTVEAVQARVAEMVALLEALSEAERARVAAGGGLAVGPKGWPARWALGEPVPGRWDYPGEAVPRRAGVPLAALDRAIEANAWLATVAATQVGEVVWRQARGESLRAIGEALALSAPFVQRMARLGWVLVCDEANRRAGVARRRMVARVAVLR